MGPPGQLASTGGIRDAAEKIEQRVRAKALVEGMAEGRAEGRVEGRAEGRRAVLSKLLTRRFGELPSSALQLLRDASEEQLDDWARMLDATLLEQVFAP